MQNPHVAFIQIFPIKALDPVILQEAKVAPHALEFDRRFAMLAEDGRYVNGKRTGKVNALKAEFDLENRVLSLGLRKGGSREKFELRGGNPALEAYLSDFFGMKIAFLERERGELMDMPEVAGLTVLSTNSLESLRRDMPRHSLEDLRLRFRSTIELDGVPAYWEDQLFGAPGTEVRFRLGEVEAVGLSPRARCTVPPRNPQTGDSENNFAKLMTLSRQEHLPEGSALPEYGHFYHLAVNVRIPESEIGKTIRVGDPIELL